MTERGANVHFPPPLVFLSLLLLGVALRYTVGPFPLTTTIWTRALGLFFLLAGLSLILSARILFVRTKQSPIPWEPTPELIFRGPYRFTRNPMYVGLTCVQIGLGLAFGNAWISLLAPVGLAIVHVIAVRPEEAYLREKFGEPYRNYCTTVRRY